MADLSERMQELEEMTQELLKMMASAQAGKILRRNLEKQEQMIDKLLQTKKTTMQLIQELMSAEEQVAQKLSDRDAELKASLQKLQEIEDRLLQEREKDGKLKTSTKELRKELEALREEIEKQEKKSAEGSSASKSAMHLSQLYYRICPIDWDYSCEPTLIKGTHHGPDVAQPFSFESGQHSRCFVSDYLWSLVPTSW
ncbi:kinetochore protein Spc24 [Heteronotia binoei]|uniref:kinetochore protein Spc24 n=1 Tax=Heteronotia binoei TaxID=13085 RepID=UPI00292DF6BA|nr:kinetochore protein Spc24 [Heteronotia binoei]